MIQILQDNGWEPGPRRGEGSGDEFLKRPAATRWAGDFVTNKAGTRTGLVHGLIRFILPVGSRRVPRVGMSANPDWAWMVQQGRNRALLFDHVRDQPQDRLRVRDRLFVQELDALVTTAGIAVKPLRVRTSKENAVVERLVGRVRQECLDRFVVFGEVHLRYILSADLISSPQRIQGCACS